MLLTCRYEGLQVGREDFPSIPTNPYRQKGTETSAYPRSASAPKLSSDDAIGTMARGIEVPAISAHYYTTTYLGSHAPEYPPKTLHAYPPTHSHTQTEMQCTCFWVNGSVGSPCFDGSRFGNTTNTRGPHTPPLGALPTRRGTQTRVGLPLLNFRHHGT